MIEYFEQFGARVFIDENGFRVSWSKDFLYEKENLVSINQISPILLNRALRYPEVVYKEYQNIHYSKLSVPNRKSKYDIVYLPAGLLGVEYIKTHIYYNPCLTTVCDSFVEVISGILTILLQKNEENGNPFSAFTSVKEFFIVNIPKGEKFAVPTGYYYSFVNTSSEPLVFAKVVSAGHCQIDYMRLQKERGLAFYLISKNAKVEVVANPKYKCLSGVKVLSFKNGIRKIFPFKAELPIFEKKSSIFALFQKSIFDRFFI